MRSRTRTSVPPPSRGPFSLYMFRGNQDPSLARVVEKTSVNRCIRGQVGSKFPSPVCRRELPFLSQVTSPRIRPLYFFTPAKTLNGVTGVSPTDRDIKYSIHWDIFTQRIDPKRLYVWDRQKDNTRKMEQYFSGLLRTLLTGKVRKSTLRGVPRCLVTKPKTEGDEQCVPSVCVHLHLNKRREGFDIRDTSVLRGTEW